MDFSSIKVGCHLVIKNRVCQVLKVDFSKPGKHGGAKKVATGRDLITDKKYIETFKHGSVFTQFTVSTTFYTVSYVDGDDLVLLTENYEENRDYRVPNGEIRETIDNYLEDGETPMIEILTVQVDGGKEEYRVMSVKL